MRLFRAAALTAAAVSAWAGDRAQVPKRELTVCINPGGASAATLARGQATASDILAQARIRLKWRIDARACIEPGSILVAVSYRTPANEHPGELAYARPFDGTRIVLFYDRVIGAVNPALAPRLLGYVLAHEIVHLLQGMDAHSSSGLMKRRWDSLDYSDMQRGRLNLTEEDIALIDRGMESRTARAASVQ